MRNKILVLSALVSILAAAPCSRAQSSTGAIEVSARITPTGARPEPVRQFTFYVLTKSYADIRKEIATMYPVPDRQEFVEALKISDELKAWIKEHDVIDLAAPDFDKLVTPEDIMKVPEFFAAYERWNSGGVTKGLPMPKFREEEKEKNPDRYAKEKEEYRVATKKFIMSHLSTIEGMELELAGVNPKYKWEKARAEQRSKVTQLGPEVAQSKYLAAKADTDLDGRANISGLAPGTYWISSLGMDAASGDRRLLWDVPAIVQPGQTTRIDLSNLNGTDLSASRQ